MGSSAIRRSIIEGKTGSTGPRGLTGPRGPTGTGAGKTGPTGATANYISAVSYNDLEGNPYVNLSDGLIFPIFGLTGATGITASLVGVTIGSGYQILQSYSGQTFTLRGLSFTGVLSSSVVDDVIKVSVQDQSFNLSVDPGSTGNRVAYSKTTSQISSSRIVIEEDSFSLSDITGVSFTSTFLDSSFNVAVIPDIPQESMPYVVDNYADISEYFTGVDEKLGVFIDVTKASVFVINTPIGISKFEVNTTLYDVGDNISFTMFVNGNDIWSFPSNVLFEDTPDSTYFGCGMNIMNITTTNKGITWYATITDRGYGATGCSDLDTLGSCCYNDSEGNFECDDYVSKDYCDRFNGTFSASKTCNESCNIEGLNTFCCSEGKCVSGVSEDECEYFGGVFFATTEELSCETDNAGTNLERLCYDKCQQPVVCCKNGVCLGEMTSKVCETIYKGRGITGTCDQVDCCREIPFYGACCRRASDEGPSSCRQDYIYNCKIEDNEVFMGDGTFCINSSTCCQAEQDYEGICCLSNGGCVGTNLQNCNQLNGRFYDGASVCDVCGEGCPDCPPPPPCTDPPCDEPCDEPTDPECPPGTASRCVTAGGRSYCYEEESNARTRCPSSCRSNRIRRRNDGDPPNTGRPSIFIPPGGGGGGGGGDGDGKQQQECLDCGQCLCPKFPINGWMFDGEPTPVIEADGAKRCVCARRGRDPNVDSVVQNLSPECQILIIAGDNDLKWQVPAGGEYTTPPSEINACCSLTGQYEEGDDARHPCVSQANACWCSEVFRPMQDPPRRYTFAAVGCCDAYPCGSDPAGLPCSKCLPILRVRTSPADIPVCCSTIPPSCPPNVICGSPNECLWRVVCKPKIGNFQDPGQCERKSNSNPASCATFAQGAGCDEPYNMDPDASVTTNPLLPPFYDGEFESSTHWVGIEPKCIQTSGNNPAKNCGFNFLPDYIGGGGSFVPTEKCLRHPITKICSVYYCDTGYSPCFDPEYLDCNNCEIEEAS